MKNMRLLITLFFSFISIHVAMAGDEVTVVAQNVQNFFYSLDRERTQGNGVPRSNYNTAEGRAAKAYAIVEALAPYEADIYAFNEIEAKAIGADKEALEVLAEEMSKETTRTYVAVSDGLTYDTSTDATGTIKSGFLYRTDRIALVGENVSTAVGYTYAYPYMLRMQTFKSLATGECFTISMNHFKASTSGNMTEDKLKREQNSIALLQGLNSAQDPDILLIGDLNSEMGEQCLDNIVSAGYEEQLLKYDGNDTYSYWYYGGSLIDHVFANSTMAAQVKDAKILHIANPHSVGYSEAYSDHDPYIITLDLAAQPAPSYHYTKAATFEPDKAYVLTAPINGLKAVCTVSVGKTYEYLSTTDVEDIDGTITIDHPRQAFTFESTDTENQYRIKDYYGRYLYQYQYNGSYYTNVNVGTKDAAHTFTVTAQSDGTYKIQNTASSYYFLIRNEGSGTAMSYRNWTTIYSGQYMPTLYQYSSTTTTAIHDIETSNTTINPRKVLVNGQLFIITPLGEQYTLQGVRVN